MIGLKRGTVALFDHENEWDEEAKRTIAALREIFGDAAVDIQHVGSTSVRSIKAKPIIDIAVGIRTFDDLMALESQLRGAGFYMRVPKGLPGQMLLACGNYYTGEGDIQTHFIHVVIYGCREWTDYINFKDYLNKTPEAARKYEELKLSLAAAAPVDAGREKYTLGKQKLIAYILRKALVDSYLGKTVDVVIDRPIGYIHRKGTKTLVYPINYGYIAGVFGGDGEELDVFVLGVDKPVKKFTGKVIAIAHRADDVEDKLIAAPEGMLYDRDAIAAAIHFQEQYYNTRIETASDNNSGDFFDVSEIQ